MQVRPTYIVTKQKIYTVPMYIRTCTPTMYKYKNHSNSDVGMHCAKIMCTRSFSIAIKDTSTTMCNPLPEYVRRGYA